jgi:hypothetical protein
MLVHLTTVGFDVHAFLLHYLENTLIIALSLVGEGEGEGKHAMSTPTLIFPHLGEAQKWWKVFVTNFPKSGTMKP